MSGSTPPRKNPFVGPRSFQEGELLHGRSRETVEIANLLIAERIVLFYSPSGAGKTSLIQAALLPKLKSRGFAPLPVVRLNLEPPPGLASVDGFNRYAFSALSSLEKHQPPSGQLADEELAQLSLDEYLSRSESNQAQGTQKNATILVFDQFEEVLTVDASDLAEKQAFFAQLGAVLEDPNRWALFSMREDYIAGLDPYLLAVPTHFRNTFRLELLSLATARQVLQQTTLQENVAFAEEAAARLIADLSRVRVQKLDGSIEDKAGVSVEPVQMQVVCFNLWQKLDVGLKTITLQEIESIGDVDQALGDYYSTQVTAVAQEQDVPERTLRRWFDQVLITSSGIRNQVLLEKDASQGLQNDTIYRLEDAHLVRLESGRNRTWVELSHDRLVAPVRNSNATWFEENLSVLQRQAGHWQAENRPAHLLLRGAALLEAQTWAGQHARDMLPEEVEFLEASQETEAKEKAALQLADAERRSRTQRRFLLLITLALLAAVIFAINSFFQSQAARSAEAAANTQRSIAEIARRTSDAASTEIADQAENERELRELAQQQEANAQAASTLAVANAELASENEELARAAAQLAFSRQLAAQGSSLLESDPELAALLAAESYSIKPGWENKSLLLEILQQQEGQTITPYGPPLPEETGALNAISAFAISPDGERLAWGTLAGQVTIWNYRTHNYEPGWDSNPLHTGNVLSLAFSPDGSLLASGGVREQQLFITNLATQTRLAELESTNRTRSLAFHPTEPILAAAIQDTLHFWNTTTWEELEARFAKEADQINDIAWSPDGQYLAFSLSADAALPNRGLGVLSWETFGVLQYFDQDVPLYQVSWSSDGTLLAAASRDGGVRFWDIPEMSVSTRATVPQLEQAVYAVAFSPDGKTFVRGGADVGFTVFSTQDFKEIARVDSPINGWIRSLNHFPEPGFNLLAAVSENQVNSRFAVNLYVVNSRQPLGTELLAGKNDIVSLFSPDFEGPSPGLVTSMDLSRDGSRIIVGEISGGLCVWDIALKSEAVCNDGGTSLVSSFSPDGERIASGRRDTSPIQDYVVVWESTSGNELVRMPHEDIVTSVAYSPDGQRVATGSFDGTARVWDVNTGQEISRTNHGASVHSIAFSADGKRVVSGSEDGTVLVWEAETGNEIVRMVHESVVTSVGFSTDGQWVVTGSYDGTAGVWEAATGREVARMSMSGAPLVSVTVSQDGTLLATGDVYGNLVLWDLSSYQPIGAPMNPGNLGIITLAFSTDERRLLTGHENGSLWEWNVDPGSWVEIACEVADGRSLTDLEQVQYFREGGYQDVCASR